MVRGLAAGRFALHVAHGACKARGGGQSSRGVPRGRIVSTADGAAGVQPALSQASFVFVFWYLFLGFGFCVLVLGLVCFCFRFCFWFGFGFGFGFLVWSGLFVFVFDLCCFGSLCFVLFWLRLGAFGLVWLRFIFCVFFCFGFRLRLQAGL